MHALALAPDGSRRWISALEARVDGRVVDVTATSSGRIARILVAEGELVEEGETLLELGDVVFAGTRVRVAIRAPTKGRILTRHLVPGDQASFGQPLLTVVEDDDVWVLARFDAAGFERLRLGQSALVRSGGRLFAAKVCALGPDDLIALLDFVLRPVALRPGMIASAVVVTDRDGT
ncbi:MAG TPA: HlyD family efflux transporter periplasmic adaptor subunit [Myxococcales bacterium]|nr:HlyD family efflux transporter periplasmic adaptor subunit [Myxococcales bacterium]